MEIMIKDNKDKDIKDTENRDMESKKKKKEKITYIDDGRTVADMSSVTGGSKFSRTSTNSSLRDIVRTYWLATKMMIMPTLCAVALILVAFAIVMLLFKLMQNYA